MKAKIPEDVTTLVKGNNAFALDLYGQLREQKGNLFFSPYSLSTALAMTYAGARSQTATQMTKVLHFTLKQEQLHSAFSALGAGLKTSDQKAYQLSIASRLWGQKDYNFLDTFLRITQDSYGAALEKVDFVEATDEARRTINNWVAQQTQEKIQNLIPEGVLNRLTQLVLTNAIYFKGNWVSQFNKKLTREEPFTVAPGNHVNVPMMYETRSFCYACLEHLKVLELPYVDNRLSMVILLPKEGDGLTELEPNLTAANLQQWLSFLQKVKVKVWIPKFKLTSAFSLNEVLSKMGMPLAFCEGKADFSSMTGYKGLFISKVIHKAFVDVNEEGTEAAAATAVVMAIKSMSALPPLPTFRADHPFVFMIRDNQSGSILFLGRVVNPLP